MASVAELMATGMPAGQANCIGQDAPLSALTATGNSQATALPLLSSFSIFSTVAASTGAVLPPAGGQGDYFIYNGGANALTVYPSLGQSINGLALNTGVSIPINKGGTFFPNGNQWGFNASA
jgi:hypothetical protein